MTSRRPVNSDVGLLLMVHSEVDYVAMVQRLLDELSNELELPNFQRKSTQMFVKNEYHVGDWIYDVDNGHVVTIWRWLESGATHSELQGPLPIVGANEEAELRAGLKDTISALIASNE